MPLFRIVPPLQDRRLQAVFEDFVMEQVQKGRSVIGLYPPTDEAARADFAAWRKATGR